MVVLVPAYEPGPALVALVQRLRHHTVVVVDDGSGPAWASVFAQARAAGAEVLTLPVNRGKGHALKTGFAHVAAHHPGEPVVCADSDGQHRVADVEAVAARLQAGDAAMVLGVRRFVGAVPARSRLGNTVTASVFGLVTGLRLTDTQTGLRAYPAWMLPWLGEVEGDRFEYELRLLMRAARERVAVVEVEIATVYLDHNASSHFRPVRDSVRVLAPLLGFAASSLLGFAVDTVALLVLAALTGSVVGAAVTARLLSATVNYTVNRRWVFGAARRRSSLLRYAALAAGVLVVNVTLLEALTTLGASLLAAKAVTEVTLFAASYLVQRHLVFPGRSPAAAPTTLPASGHKLQETGTQNRNR